MKKLKLFIVGILTCLSSSVLASEWYDAYSDDNVTVFVYNEYKKSSEGFKVWTEWYFNSPQKLVDDEYYSIKEYIEYSSDFDKSKSLTTTFYSREGKVIYTNTPSVAKWDYIVPGSVGNAVADFIYDMVKYDL